MIDGWAASVGVQAEIRQATELGKPVRYLSPDDLDELSGVAKETID
jgi:hypothetical protein